MRNLLPRIISSIFFLLLTMPSLANSYYHPEWSPNGKRIAFYGYVGKQPDIFIYDFEKKQVTRITESEDNWEIEPKWFDDKQLMIGSGKNMRKIRLTSLDIPTGTQRKIAEHVELLMFIGKAKTFQVKTESSKSNDSQMLVNWQKDGKFNLYRMNADGSNPQKLTDYDELFAQQLLPESNQILVTYQSDAHLLNLDGKIATNLTQSAIKVSHPNLSPDRTKLVYVANHQNGSDLYLKNLTDDTHQRLTNDEFPEYAPKFSPDGNLIVFSGFMDGHMNIILWNLSTGAKINITKNLH